MLDRILLEARLILDFCLLGIFKLQFQFYYLWLICSFSLFLVFFPPDSVVGDWTFLRVCPFLLVFHFIGIQLLVVVSYDSLCFCGISYNFSVFISIYWFWCLSFFDESGWRFINFVYLFKGPTFSFSDLFYHFVYISFISALIFMFFSLLLTLSFVCSFSSCLGLGLGCLFDIFSCFLR